MEGVLGFPGFSRYEEELYPLRERQNIQNWTLQEWGLGFFQNSHGLQKYLKQTEGVQICLKSQALTRCSLLMPNGIKIK